VIDLRDATRLAEVCAGEPGMLPPPVGAVSLLGIDGTIYVSVIPALTGDPAMLDEALVCTSRCDLTVPRVVRAIRKAAMTRSASDRRPAIDWDWRATAKALVERADRANVPQRTE
jgi:hypothetical protein